MANAVNSFEYYGVTPIQALDVAVCYVYIDYNKCWTENSDRSGVLDSSIIPSTAEDIVATLRGYDLNGDGIIDFTESNKAMLQLGEKLKERKVKSL